jgi:hypothetical protein
MIGSASKRARFEHRLVERGVPAERLEELTCPIGVGGIESKQPQSDRSTSLTRKCPANWRAMQQPPPSSVRLHIPGALNETRAPRSAAY